MKVDNVEFLNDLQQLQGQAQNVLGAIRQSLDNMQLSNVALPHPAFANLLKQCEQARDLVQKIGVAIETKYTQATGRKI